MAGNRIPAHSCSVCLRSVRANTSRQATGFTVNNRSMIGNTFYGECGSQRSLLDRLVPLPTTALPLCLKVGRDRSSAIRADPARGRDLAPSCRSTSSLWKYVPTCASWQLQPLRGLARLRLIGLRKGRFGRHGSEAVSSSRAYRFVC